ncbi:XRE family transcriptional regulator [Streptomyces sp. NPDC058301]|uniref:XRE family transcriptional regulator n=1 Tax=Streptomyces sp. NPDC058301 TaxID=3346436 RepID=UPI0036EA4779
MLTGAAATAPALALLLGPMAEASAAPSGQPSERLVGSIERAVRDLREIDDSTGSASGDLAWGVGLWQSASRVVAQARSRGPVTDRLHTAYIELSEQVGWMCFDARQHPQAQRIYHTGMRLARETNTSLTARHSTANLVASAAYQAAWLGHHNDAAALLDIAARTPELPSAAAAVIGERRICAAGRRHDPDAVLRFRNDALLHLPSPDEHTPWWATWLTTDSLDAATGRAWLACDNPSRAVPFLSRRVEAITLPTTRATASTPCSTWPTPSTGADTATRPERSSIRPKGSSAPSAHSAWPNGSRPCRRPSPAYESRNATGSAAPTTCSSGQARVHANKVSPRPVRRVVAGG